MVGGAVGGDDWWCCGGVMISDVVEGCMFYVLWWKMLCLFDVLAEV